MPWWLEQYFKSILWLQERYKRSEIIGASRVDTEANGTDAHMTNLN